MLTVAQADGPNLIAVGDWTGRATPLHCVASGKVLLSALAEREVLRIVRRGLVSYTERTITELEPLLEELARIRRRGYATAIGEYELGPQRGRRARSTTRAATSSPRSTSGARPSGSPRAASRSSPPRPARPPRPSRSASAARRPSARRRSRSPPRPDARPIPRRATLSACPTSTSRPGPTSPRSCAPTCSRCCSSWSSRSSRCGSPGSSSTAIVKALLDREATEGTAQELTAVEVTKRMDTLDDAARQRRPVLHRGRSPA